MTKKIAVSVIFILLLFAGIIALTQEADSDLPFLELDSELDEAEDSSSYSRKEIRLPEWFNGARWFRSNAGGMAIEEINSSLTALRNVYALVIDLAQKEDIPEYLFPFYDDSYFIEIRVLFKNGKQFKTQWIFRDEIGRARLVAVFSEKEAEQGIQTEVIEDKDAVGIQELLTVLSENEIVSTEDAVLLDDIKDTVHLYSDEIQEKLNDELDDGVIMELAALLTENEIVKEVQADVSDSPWEKKETADKNNLSGFIEIYDENLFLSAEYKFFLDGSRSRTDYVYKDGLLFSSTVLLWEENNNGAWYNIDRPFIRTELSGVTGLSNEEGLSIEGELSNETEMSNEEIMLLDTRLSRETRQFIETKLSNYTGQSNEDGKNAEEVQYTLIYTDYYRYNRSSYLRSVRRVFYKEKKISTDDESVVVTFPSGILAAAKEMAFINERHNSYPEFFGEIAVKKDSAFVYSTDEKGRIVSQTFYDNDNIIWVIYNTWSDDRIVSAVKEEGENIYLAEYEYDSDGDRVMERNYTNGILQRVVSTEGKKDIEELYFNGKVILRAVWENGRKVSETRIR